MADSILPEAPPSNSTVPNDELKCDPRIAGISSVLEGVALQLRGLAEAMGHHPTACSGPLGGFSQVLDDIAGQVEELQEHIAKDGY
jgi:hypothetical protein